MPTIQGPGRYPLNRRTLLKRVLGAAGAALVFGAQASTVRARASTVTALPALRDGAPVADDEAIGLRIRSPRGDYDVLLAPGSGTYQIGGLQLSGGQMLVEHPTDGTTEQAALA